MLKFGQEKCTIRASKQFEEKDYAQNNKHYEVTYNDKETFQQ